MPFDDLPLEIIQYVFSLCCRRVKFTIPPKHIDQSGITQVTLSLVCSRWREIVLNTSALWGDIVVIYEPYRPAPTSAPLQFVQNWLNRAGTAPISLYILVCSASESQIGAISHLLSSFHVTDLRLESIEYYHLLLHNNSYYLESLHLSLYKPKGTTNTLRLPEMPSLKRLHLCLHPSIFVDPNIGLIPWHQLRVFILSEKYWSSQILFNILQKCKSLVECTLFLKLEYRQDEHDIVLLNLESLVLDMNSQGSGVNADPIIWSLTLPNLRSLEIRSWGPQMTFPLSTESIVIMAHRSGFNKRLTDFSLCGTQQPVDVRSLLGSMPALESVRLLGPLIFRPGTFDGLSSGMIGPRLEEIHFGIMSDEEIGLLLETVGHRHEKAKAVSDIRPFALVACRCTRESDFESHKQRAKQCGEAFNAHVEIFTDHLALGTMLVSDSSDEDDDSLELQ